jgi:hypothetical protein
MPWASFTTIAKSSYNATAQIGSLAKMARPYGIGGVHFNCGHGEYKDAVKLSGWTVIVSIWIVLLCSAVLYTTCTKHYGRAGGAREGGLSIQADNGAAFNVTQAPRRTTSINSSVPWDESSGAEAGGGSYEGDVAGGGDGLGAALLGAHAADPATRLKKHRDAIVEIETKLKKEDKMTVGKAFDPERNFASLMEQSPQRTIGGLDGLKTLSMLQIILVHTGLLSLLAGQQTTQSYLDFISQFDSQFMIATDKAVVRCTFFDRDSHSRVPMVPMPARL